MTKESEQDNNTKWVYDLIRRPLLTATENTVQVIRGDSDSSKFEFSREVFFSLSPEAVHFNAFEMQLFYNTNKITADSISYLKSFFDQDDFIIGYEISEQTRAIFDAAKLNYIDFWLHPVRFLDDILFAFKSNITEIDCELQKFNFGESKIYPYADRLKVQNYKGFQRIKDTLKEDSALFIGQTLTDKAIFKDGCMLTLLNFQEEFIALTKKYNHVYYSRHPFVKSGDEEVISFIKKFKNVSLVDTPTYQLLASNEIKEVVTISSSVAIEAKFFDKIYTYLLKPVVNIDEITPINERYHSIYHDFLTANFWSKILAPITHTVDVPEDGFVESSDKLRDALSFYWGYRDIDKVEVLKKTVGSLFKKKNNNTLKEATIEKKIQEANVVSFDIFDTLITRTYISPREIFTFMNAEVREISNGFITNFRQLRIHAEDKAMKDARELGKQDISLNDIYVALVTYFNISDELGEKIKTLEIKEEQRHVKSKQNGIDIFNYCRKLGKNIILISDMYLPREVILSLLDKCGISEVHFHKLYLSNEYGVRKTEGDLFKVVLTELGLKPKQLLHIGDNSLGDIKTPNSMCINTHHTPRAATLFERANQHTKPVFEHFQKARTSSTSAMLHMIISRFYNDPEKQSGIFNNDPYRIGYMAMGPMIFGFSQWLVKQAQQNGINKLFFLSRDGKIFKDVFDIIADRLGLEIQTDYVYSSRRISKLASIKSSIDIWGICNAAIYSTSLQRWFLTNFDLDISSVPLQQFRDYNFTSPNQDIGNKVNRNDLYDLCLSMKTEILAISNVNRKNYNSYLKHHGLDKENIGIVDIGYAGTMQEYFENQFSNNIQGFYLGTFDSVFTKSGLSAMNTHGYLTHLGADNDANNLLSTHRFIYESLICAPEDSFIKTTELNNNNFQHSFTESNYDEARKRLVFNVHSGTVSFAKELCEWVDDINSIYLEPRNARFIFDRFLKSPSDVDARLLSGIVFDDSFGPESLRYLIPPSSFTDTIKNEHIIWKEGYSAIQNHVPATEKDTATKRRYLGSIKKLVLMPEELLITRFCNDRLAAKYKRDRKSFFMDSKSPIVGIYSKLFTR